MTKFQTLIKLYLFIFVFCTLAENAFSETTSINLQGMNKRDLIKIIGRPTSSGGLPPSRNDANNDITSETLYYGNSHVRLINDKVNTVVDLGDLKALLANNKDKALGYSINNRWEDWPNPWTPPKTLIVDIINEGE